MDALFIVRFVLCRSVVAVVPEDCVDRLAGPLVRGWQEVGVGPQGETRVAVAQVLTECLDRFAVEELARIEVAQRMASVLTLGFQAGLLQRGPPDPGVEVVAISVRRVREW